MPAPFYLHHYRIHARKLSAYDTQPVAHPVKFSPLHHPYHPFAFGSLTVPMSTFVPNAPTTCYRLLTELQQVPSSDLNAFNALTLPRDLMFSDDAENRVPHPLRLATFLLAWKALEDITIAMPDDLNAAEKESDDYDFWSWALHRPLLAAFTQGRWRELRLLHPHRYLDTSVFLFHNMHYIERWILPEEPRLQQETRRRRYSELESNRACNHD